jgi:hypothetical protein
MWLKNYTDLITYRPSQCGPSAPEALPSIIVSYPQGLSDSLLKNEFDKVGTRFQYATGPGPSFKLYYCPLAVPAFIPKGDPHSIPPHLGGLDVSEFNAKDISLCGQRLPCNPPSQDRPSSFATYTCMLEINGESFGLLSAHPFCDTTRQDALLNELSELADYDGDDEDVVFDDDQIDDSEHDAAPAPVTRVFQIDQSTQEILLQPTDATVASEITAQVSSNAPTELGKPNIIMPGPNDLVDDPDCDWALKPLEDASQRLPNLYTRDQDSTRFCHITEVASSDAGNDAAVDVVTESGVKCGTLLPGFVNLPGLSGRSFCNARMVSMDTGIGKFCLSRCSSWLISCF